MESGKGKPLSQKMTGLSICERLAILSLEVSNLKTWLYPGRFYSGTMAVSILILQFQLRAFPPFSFILAFRRNGLSHNFSRWSHSVCFQH